MTRWLVVVTLTLISSASNSIAQTYESDTVGAMRVNCLAFENTLGSDESFGLGDPVNAFQVGRCVEFLTQQRYWRTNSCIDTIFAGESENLKGRLTLIGRNFEDADNLQLARAFLNWTADKPDQWRERLNPGEVSLFTQWPCKFKE